MIQVNIFMMVFKIYVWIGEDIDGLVQESVTPVR